MWAIIGDYHIHVHIVNNCEDCEFKTDMDSEVQGSP